MQQNGIEACRFEDKAFEKQERSSGEGTEKGIG
jgi:hypothetical protein